MNTNGIRPVNTCRKLLKKKKYVGASGLLVAGMIFKTLMEADRTLEKENASAEIL